MKYTLSLFLILLTGLIHANENGHLEITTAQGQGADAHVFGAEAGIKESKAEINYGNQGEMTFKGSPNINYHAALYLRFDLSKLEGRRVQHALLRLHTTDGISPAVDRVQLHHSSTAHHKSRFADIRIAAGFDDLINARKLLVSAEFSGGDQQTELDGLEAGLGFEEPWRTDNSFNQIEESFPAREGWQSLGRAVKIRGDVTRSLTKELHAERGTLWLAGFIESISASRTASVSFGALDVSHSAGGPLHLNGRKANVPSQDGLNLFVVRLDFDPTGNRMWLWSNPDLTKGEPSVETSNAHVVQTSQHKTVTASLYGLRNDIVAGPRLDGEGKHGINQLGENWDENKITWRNAPGGFAGSLQDRVASGQVYHLYTQNLQIGREGLVVNISAPKLTWYLNQNNSGIATLILQGRDDRVLNIAAKEHPLLPPPTLVIDFE